MDQYTLAVDLIDFQYASKSHGSFRHNRRNLDLTLES